ncbi:hypothetical protein yaldo0001_11830 [Yersinia aldovae ATCC 35236]|nr:hypothetical protein yaldo0001_11830 [Yersinia aldovae ATCC 35236]
MISQKQSLYPLAELFIETMSNSALMVIDFNISGRYISAHTRHNLYLHDLNKNYG